MKYNVETTKDLQQPTPSVKSFPQNRWVMSSNVVELNRKYTQSEDTTTEDKKAALFDKMPIRRKSWVAWPKF